MSEDTMGWLLERAEGWEAKARDLYAALADLFREFPEIARFWEQMSKDEAEHVAIVRRIRDAIPPERLAAAIVERLMQFGRHWNVADRMRLGIPGKSP